MKDFEQQAHVVTSVFPKYPLSSHGKTRLEKQAGPHHVRIPPAHVVLLHRSQRQRRNGLVLPGSKPRGRAGGGAEKVRWIIPHGVLLKHTHTHTHTQPYALEPSRLGRLWFVSCDALATLIPSRWPSLLCCINRQMEAKEPQQRKAGTDPSMMDPACDPRSSYT